MTPEKIEDVTRKYKTLLLESFGGPAQRNQDSTSLRDRIGHLLWMCDQTFTFTTQQRLDKAFRWLGFLQGAFWALGIQNIEESKKDNTPEGVEFDKQKV